ncbi:MAG: UDP-N-acetylmuramate dehydrogenase, partial [Bacteroidota bacterium]
MSSSAQHTLRIQSDVLLSDLTTIHLGGRARYFAACRAIDDIREALAFAREKSIRVCVLGGGSNVIFADEGFDGLVIHIETSGVAVQDDEDATMISAAAGEGWDPFIERCIEKGLGGIECLSGIPGLVGATPIQNVGAYGQEVCDTIVSVRALDRETLDVVEFPNRDCGFGYRQSRFKSTDADRFVISDVKFRLRKHGRPEIRYPELQRFIASTADLNSLPDGEPILRAAREAVITLRRRKSMVIDPRDPNSRSVGSF